MAPDSNFWHVAEAFIAQLGERQTEDLEVSNSILLEGRSPFSIVLYQGVGI
jgi:hypothetical protein